MGYMNKTQKGLIQTLILVAVVVLILALAAVGYLMLGRNRQAGNPLQNFGTLNQPQNQVAPINSANDLNSASNSLDATDTTQIDTQLDQLDTEASF
jgi:flagellar basal body-associated protein FliL